MYVIGKGCYRHGGQVSACYPLDHESVYVEKHRQHEKPHAFSLYN